jgi:hypothetical protein
MRLILAEILVPLIPIVVGSVILWLGIKRGWRGKDPTK